MVVRRVPGRLPGLMLIVLSLTVSCRYLWWRYTATLNWDDPLSPVCGLLLLVAETYARVVLVLGYFQTVWPLNRQPVPLPADSATADHRSDGADLQRRSRGGEAHHLRGVGHRLAERKGEHLYPR